MKRYYMINRKFLVLSSQGVCLVLKSGGTFDVSLQLPLHESIILSLKICRTEMYTGNSDMRLFLPVEFNFLMVSFLVYLILSGSVNRTVKDKGSKILSPSRLEIFHNFNKAFPK